MEIDVVVMIECVLNTINDAHTSMFTQGCINFTKDDVEPIDELEDVQNNISIDGYVNLTLQLMAFQDSLLMKIYSLMGQMIICWILN